MNRSRRNYDAYRRRSLLLVPLLVLAVSGALIAAPGQAPRPAPPPQDADDVGKTIQVLMVLSLKKALNLTRDQELEVIPRIQRIFEERERFTRQRQDALRRVEVKLREESVPEQEFRDVVLRLDQLERHHRELEVRLRSEIDRSLNSRQQAGLRLFVPQFRRQVQSQIDEARRLNRQGLSGSVPPVLAVPDDVYYADDEEF